MKKQEEMGDSTSDDAETLLEKITSSKYEALPPAEQAMLLRAFLKVTEGETGEHETTVAE